MGHLAGEHHGHCATANSVRHFRVNQALQQGIQCILATFLLLLETEPCSIYYLPSFLVLTLKASTGELCFVSLFLALLSHFGFPTVFYTD